MKSKLIHENVDLLSYRFMVHVRFFSSFVSVLTVLVCGRCVTCRCFSYGIGYMNYQLSCCSNTVMWCVPFLSTASSSNYVHNNTHLALNVLETRSSHASPDEFWFALGGPYTAERLQVYPAFVCTLHDNHGVMM